MANVDPTTGASSNASSNQATITTGPEGLTVSVGPGGVRAGGVGFIIGLIFWLPAALWVGALVRHMRPLDVLHFPAVLNAFPVVWLALWTFFGLSLVKGFLFAFWGRQQLTVGPSTVTLRATLFGQSRSKDFTLDQVQNVRIPGSRTNTVLVLVPGESQPEQVTIDQTPTVPASGAPIAFDVGGKTYRFGINLDSETLRTIQDAIARSRKG